MSSTIKAAIQALKSRIADAYTAISQKGGTLPATQDSANLPAAIASIPSGGGEEPLPNDFNFVDFNGLVCSFSKEEIDAMTELPTPKQYDGLEFEGWSRTLSELQSLGCCTIGGFYHLTDCVGKAVFDIPADGTTISIECRATGGTIDWGDGTTSATGWSNTHIYAQAGIYTIKVQNVHYFATSAAKYYIKEYYLNAGVGFSSQNFRGAIYLEKMCLSKDLSPFPASGSYMWEGNAFKTLILPPSYTEQVAAVAYYMGFLYNLQYIVADGAGVFGCVLNNRFSNLISFSLKSVTTTSGGDYQSYMGNLRYIQFDSIQTLANNRTFSQCNYFEKVDLPATLQSIDIAIGGRIQKALYVRATTPPTMGGAFFSLSSYCKIHIPAGTLAAYESATNWASYAGLYIDDL